MESAGPVARAGRSLRVWTAAAALAGATLACVLIARFGLESVIVLLRHAGFGIAAVIAFHVVQLWLTALGWRALMPAGPATPSRGFVTLLRLIREGINTLLPTAQVGGLVVAVRVLCRRGLRPSEAVAATVVDVTVELVTQVVFTLMGLGLLVALLGALPRAVPLIGGLAVIGAMVMALVAAQRIGLARIALRAAARFGWAQRMAGLDGVIAGLYRRRDRLAWSAACHLLAWALGAVEVGLALHVLGHDVGLAEAFVIESLGQVVKIAAFAIPGALGVQEGGYVILCGLFGLAPDVAIALSLVKRIREVALGAPSIALWLRLERAEAAEAG